MAIGLPAVVVVEIRKAIGQPDHRQNDSSLGNNEARHLQDAGLLPFALSRFREYIPARTASLAAEPVDSPSAVPIP